MHDAAFAMAARQAPTTILRLPMLPYSIGHEIILLAERNPLLFGAASDDDKRAGLIRAALVCYRTWSQNQNPERNLWLWGWTIRNADWKKEVEAFEAYRVAGSNCPPAPTQENYEIANGLQKEERGREFGGSFLACVVGYLSRINLAGYETPFDVPLGLAYHLYLSELEIDGKARIENAREAQVRMEMDEHRAAIAKEKDAQCQP